MKSVDLTKTDLSTERNLSDAWASAVESGELTSGEPTVATVTVNQYRQIANFCWTDMNSMTWGIGPYKFQFAI